MMTFPQIGRGSVAQFPLGRVRKWRSITNEMESGELIRLADGSTGEIDWRLSFEELTDTESGALASLFAAVKGGFGPFLFIDPLANLLGWSEELSTPDWQSGLLQISSGATDPAGTQRASSIHNPAAGVQMIQQSIVMPGDYTGCLSVWMRSSAPGELTLARDSRSAPCQLGTTWKRFFVSGVGASGAGQSTFSLTLAAGQAIDVWGFQAEAQPYPSQYKRSASALGIYAETYFADDELSITSTGVGLASCEIRLRSRVQ
jgi:hypothetical protein